MSNKTALRAVGWTVATVALAGTAFVGGMRYRISPVVNTQRRINKHLLNPVQLRSAGGPGSPYSVVEHAGRATGAIYRTPVGAVPTEDGFVIGLVYGEGTDWLRNVLASGGATIVHDGQSHPVSDPRIVPASAASAYFRARDRRAQSLFGVREFVMLRHLDPSA